MCEPEKKCTVLLGQKVQCTALPDGKMHYLLFTIRTEKIKTFCQILRNLLGCEDSLLSISVRMFDMFFETLGDVCLTCLALLCHLFSYLFCFFSFLGGNMREILRAINNSGREKSGIPKHEHTGKHYVSYSQSNGS